MSRSGDGIFARGMTSAEVELSADPFLIRSRQSAEPLRDASFDAVTSLALRMAVFVVALLPARDRGVAPAACTDRGDVMMVSVSCC